MRNLVRALTSLALISGGGACGTAPAGQTTPPAVAAARAGALVLPPAPSQHLEDELGGWARALPLPAVSADGEVVAVDAADDDGARGNANMAIEVRRVKDDLLLETLPILGAEEFEAALAQVGDDPAAVDAALGPVVAARVQASNAALATRRWLPVDVVLAQGEPTSEDTPYSMGPWQAEERGLSVVIDGARLTVTQRGRTLVAAEHPEWMAPVQYRCADEDMTTMTPDEIASECACANPAFIRGARLAPAQKVLLVDIAYVGDDSCWEPDGQWHVVALPGLE